MNIPNILTIIRLFLVPVFIFVYGDGSEFSARITASVIFIVASATDVLDGYIARKYNKITDFGKLADPVADKLMQLSVVGCLAINKRISIWILALFALKELVLILGGLNLLKDKFVVQSKWTGKISTVVLFFCITVILATDRTVLPEKYATLIMCISLAFTIVAFFDYFNMFLRVKENISKSHKEIK